MHLLGQTLELTGDSRSESVSICLYTGKWFKGTAWRLIPQKALSDRLSSILAALVIDSTWTEEPDDASSVIF